MAFLSPLCHQDTGEDTPVSWCLAVPHLPGEGAVNPQLRGNSDAPEGCKGSKIACQQSASRGVRLHPGGLGGSTETSVT